MYNILVSFSDFPLVCWLLIIGIVYVTIKYAITLQDPLSRISNDSVEWEVESPTIKNNQNKCKCGKD
jgi:hypothetical protein